MKDISLKFTKLHWVKNVKTLAMCRLWSTMGGSTWHVIRRRATAGMTYLMLRFNLNTEWKKHL